MSARTRAEFLEFLCLIFSIPPTVSEGPDAATMRRIARSGLIAGPEIADPAEPASEDDRRMIAVAHRLVDLGAGDDDLRRIAAALEGTCGACDPSTPCPRRCDTLDTLRSILLQLQERARDPAPRALMRAPHIGRAIRSIDALGDFV